jgi:hypothetical protein
VFEAGGDLSRVVVYPNPWIEEKAHGRKWVSFIRLPLKAQVVLYTVDGRKVKTLTVTDPTGRVQWDLANESGHSVAAGIYLYVISDEAGHQATGKVAILRTYVF